MSFIINVAVVIRLKTAPFSLAKLGVAKIKVITLDKVGSGQYLARNIYLNRRLLLAKGVKLDSYLVRRLKYLGFKSVYVTDHTMEGIEYIELVDPELRMKAISTVQDVMDNEDFLNDLHKVGRIKGLSREIISEIVSMKRDITIEFPELKTFDEYVYIHSVNVAILGGLIGKDLGLNETRLEDFVLGAILHDIGKVDIPEEILNKNTKLTYEEFEVMKQHTIKGFKRLNTKTLIVPRAYTIALQHHEAYDGSGYPRGKRGKEIHIFSRIAEVVDIFDALTSERPYKTRWSFEDTLDYFTTKIYDKLDPKVLGAFLSRVPRYPVGTEVKLSTGETGIVLQNNFHDLSRPKIRIIKDYKEREIPPSEYYEINLVEEQGVRIKTAVS